MELNTNGWRIFWSRDDGAIMAAILITTCAHHRRATLKERNEKKWIPRGWRIFSPIVRWRLCGNVCAVNNSYYAWKSASHCKFGFNVGLINYREFDLRGWFHNTQLAWSRALRKVPVAGSPARLSGCWHRGSFPRGVLKGCGSGRQSF